jgi:WD40 repeat protein
VNSWARGYSHLIFSLVLDSFSTQAQPSVPDNANISYAATSSRDKTIKIWDALRGQCLHTLVSSVIHLISWIVFYRLCRLATTTGCALSFFIQMASICSLQPMITRYEFGSSKLGDVFAKSRPMNDLSHPSRGDGRL